MIPTIDTIDSEGEKEQHYEVPRLKIPRQFPAILDAHYLGT